MYLLVRVSNRHHDRLLGIASKAGVPVATLSGRLLMDYLDGKMTYKKVSQVKAHSFEQPRGISS